MASTSLEKRIKNKENRIKELEEQQKKVQQKLTAARRDLKVLKADKVDALLSESHLTYEDIATLLQKERHDEAPEFH
ncbi:hypothetical protein [Lacticaseibacillus paracasei]|uniref:hypothetical protein n=1 Tax=Lacticaseibacillus paracasei TaxID=1597 RepID=UPI0021A78CEA|nr:hypothetical protein [Lacticaseibacillus paracasei]MCT4385454.1 hypothetical protein [Lacticaseibacillus paracasei]